MLVGCPQCKTRYRIDDERVVPEGIKLRCTSCRTIFRVVPRPAAVAAPAPAVVAPPVAPPTPATPPPSRPPQPTPAAAPTPAAGRIRVAVANESVPFCQAVRKVLANEPFDVVSFHDGAEAFASMQQNPPQVALLDVALPGMYGFELCERLKKTPATQGVKIILIAAIYDKTRYKREPANLYGADDYIEKHHIPDELAAKVYALVSGQTAAQPAGPTAPAEEEATAAPQWLSHQEEQAQEAVRQELRQAEEAVTTPAAAHPTKPAELSEAQQKARRLARIIVSDIALYNEAQVKDGVRNGNLFQLLESEIQEGRLHYEQKIPLEVRGGTRFLEEAFEELIAKKKKELGIA